MLFERFLRFVPLHQFLLRFGLVIPFYRSFRFGFPQFLGFNFCVDILFELVPSSIFQFEVLKNRRFCSESGAFRFGIVCGAVHVEDYSCESTHIMFEVVISFDDCERFEVVLCCNLYINVLPLRLP